MPSNSFCSGLYPSNSQDHNLTENGLRIDRRVDGTDLNIGRISPARKPMRLFEMNGCVKAKTASMPSEDAKKPKPPSAESPLQKPAKPVNAKKASQPTTASVKTEQPRINETSNGNIRRDT